LFKDGCSLEDADDLIVPSMRSRETVYVALHATIVGKVRLAESVSMWPGSVVRGDS